MWNMLAILGPTASGKSAVALELARRLGAEMVSCDSMQVYRGLDIGTAKPTPAERAAVPHHLIDLLPISEPFNVARFCALARPGLREIAARGRSVILAGGSGLYAKALIYGVSLQPADAALAARVWDEVQAEGGRERLLEELRHVSPELAAAVAANPRRLARAVEVARLTGKDLRPLAESSPAMAAGSAATWLQIVLDPDPDLLRGRIRRRVGEMLDAGWIEETKQLVGQGLLETPTARQALGYVLIAQFLAGVITARPELEALLVAKTWQYAKRQRTWFRHQHPGAVMLSVGEGDTLETLANRILSLPQKNT